MSGIFLLYRLYVRLMKGGGVLMLLVEYQKKLVTRSVVNRRTTSYPTDTTITRIRGGNSDVEKNERVRLENEKGIQEEQIYC